MDSTWREAVGAGGRARWAVAVSLLLALPAAAQCTKDTDCKGERICQAGACVAPAPGTVTAPAVAPAPSASDWAARQPVRVAHWARPAGTTGVIVGALVLAFGAAAAITTGNDISTAFGVLAFLSAAIGAPIVAVGGATARFDDAITGSAVNRIVGWVGYGLAMFLAAGMITASLVFDFSFTTPFILSVAVLGATSLACLAVDAFTSASQADNLAAGRRVSSRTVVLPVVSLSRRPTGEVVPVGGLVAVF